MARLNAKWDNFTNRGQIWDHFWQDTSSITAVTYNQVGQAQAAILASYQVYSQSLASVVAIYNASGLAQASIKAVGYSFANSQVWIQTISFVYSNAQSTVLQTYLFSAQANSQVVLTNYAVGNSIAQIISFDVQQYGQAQTSIFGEEAQVGPYGQALAMIAIQRYTIVFKDTFSRTLLPSPPFNLGSPEIGLAWQWSSNDSGYTEITSPTHADEYLIGPTGSAYDSFIGPLSITQGELYFDFLIPVSTSDNNWDYRYYDESFVINVAGYTATQIMVVGADTNYYIDIIRGSWYRLHAYIDIEATDKVRVSVWKVGDSEPTLTTVQTSTYSHNRYFDIYYAPSTETVKLDNFIVYAIGPFIYNQGQANAQAHIISTPQQYGQAHVTLNQSQYTGQALADILSVYQVYSQAQASILKSSGFGQAAARVAISPTDFYAYVVSQDGAASYWPMDVIANAGIDIIDSQVLEPYNLYYFNAYNYEQKGINSPQYKSIAFYYYYGYLKTYSPVRFNGPQWTIEGWASFDVINKRVPVFGFIRSASQYLSIGLGGATSGSAGNYISAYHYFSGTAHTYTNSVDIAANTWYYLVLTYNNGLYTLYVNGVQTAQWSAPSSVGSSFYINNDPFYGQPTNVYTGIDGVAAYDLVLTQNQITNHFIAGKLQGYGQALALINRHWALAQADSKINAFNVNAYAQAGFLYAQGIMTAQAQAHILGISYKSAQSQARLYAFDYPRHAQAQTMIIPFYGLLKYYITGSVNEYTIADTGTPSNTVVTADTDVGQINVPNLPGDWIGLRWQAWFTADQTGNWFFKTTSDDGSVVNIYNEQNQLVGTMNNNYGGGQGITTRDSDTSPNVRIPLVAGTKYKIDIKYSARDGTDVISAWYRRPLDTVDIYMNAGAAPWNDKTVKYWGSANANAWTVYRGPGGEYIWPRFAQAQARIYLGELKKYGQAQTQIGGFQYGQAITQIINETDNYRLAVLADHPIVYYPLDETSYGSGILSSIVGRRNAVWSGSTGQTFGQPGAILSGTSIYFDNRSALDAGQDMRNGVPSTLPLTIPGYQGQENNMNVISQTWWGVAGDVVTIHITTPPTSNDIGIYQIGGENQWWSKNGYQTTGGLVGTAGTDVSFTLTSTGPHFVYIWTYNAGYTGTGTVTINSGGPIAPESSIPMAAGSAITVETWVKWDGTTDYRMILGFDSYDFYIRNGNIGFNAAAGAWETTTTPITSGIWYHVVGIMYNAQTFSIANKIYVNGVLQALSGTSQTGYFQPYFNIGGWSENTGYNVYSTLDEFSIFNYDLTAEQVLAHYRARIIQWYAQAQARIYSFGYPQWAQAQAYMKGLEFAQAQAHIKGYSARSAQATSLITRDGEGLVRMIWTGEYTPYPENIINWAIEDSANQIYYSSGGTDIPYYPGGNAGAAWTARFVADATGTWQFRTSSDDNSQIFINSTEVVANYHTSFYESGHGNETASGSIALTQGQEYNLHIRWTQGVGPWNIYVYYKRPTDSDWILITNGGPPWLLVAKVRVFAQARVSILEQPHKYEYAQAQARIIAFKVKGYGQSNADILQTYTVYAQAQFQIGHWQYGISGTRILRQYQVYAQAQFWYLPPTWHGIAQARIIAFNVPRYAQAQAKLRAFDVNRFAQAQSYIIRIGTGQAQSQIKQTYPLFYLNNYALTALGATASCNEDYVIFDPTDPNNGMPINVLDGNLGTLWTSYVNPAPDPEVPSDFAYVAIDLGSVKTITGYYIVPHKYNATVNLQRSNNGTSWIDVVTDIYFPVHIDTPLNSSNAVKDFIPATSARYWRLLVTNGGDDDQISLATFHIGAASIQSPTFAQAQAMFGHYVIAQASVYISPSFDQNVYGQANTDILQTIYTYAQSQVWMIPPTQWAQAQVMTVSTYTQYAQSNVWMIPPTQWSQAGAKLNAYNVNAYGKARTWVIGQYFKFAQAPAKITKPIAHGQAAVAIFKFGVNRTAYSMAYIGHFQFGQAQAWILNGYHANAAAWIKADYIKSANIMALIQRFDQWAYAQAKILQVYQKYGVAGAVINQAMVVGSANARIATIYNKYARSMARILQIYFDLAQANVWILIKPSVTGQAAVFIVKTSTRSAQATVQIGGYQYAQAQARTLAFNVPKYAQAVCYILADINVLPSVPTSGYATYRVQYDGHLLPGYAQSESFDSIQNITDHYATYINGSLSEYTGLQNKTITITMLVWEPSYLQCKLKVQEAASILRGVRRRFAKLYIQREDRYYLAIPKSITMSKNVPTSSQTLTYDITFEAKPWIISNYTSMISLSGTGGISDGSSNPYVPPVGAIRSYSGLSQTKISGIGTIKFALSQAKIVTTQGHAQSRVLITKTAGFGQARVNIRNSYKVVGLARVRITRKQGIGQARVVIIALPGAPTNLVATPGDARVTLNWNPPSYG